ncbi:MAG TPA: rhomboid family intramembrane serine protease [Candidatus Methylomirabilis sp.]|nr:rhomboid family intramembrane serine protease [Candidatus Methylomirabilis sp.]
MILPLGDAPNPEGTPLITYALILANCAAYILIALPLSAQAPDPNDPALWEYVRLVKQTLPRQAPVEEILSHISEYDLFVFRYGFRPAAPTIVTLFSAMFLHAGFLHLFGNMLFLWIYGDNVEKRMGHLSYLFWYLVTGVAATLFHTLFAPESPLPLIGASGAISGVLGFYFLWFPRNSVRLLFFFFPFFMNVFMVPARIVLGLYLLADNLLPFLITRGAGGGVAHGAHIGGFLVGLAVAWVMDRRQVTGRPREYRAVSATAESGETPAQSLARAIAGGDFATAAQAYFALSPDQTRRVLQPEDSLALADWLQQNGHPNAALTVYRRHLRDYPEGPGAAEAHVGAGSVQLDSPSLATSAYQHFLDALDLNPSSDTAARARAGLDAIVGRQKFQIGRPRR